MTPYGYAAWVPAVKMGVLFLLGISVFLSVLVRLGWAWLGGESDWWPISMTAASTCTWLRVFLG